MTSAEKRDAVLAAALVKPILMGIVNVTPDSFSDGGQYLAPEAAIEAARRHVAEGAAVIDVGAESTRPGYTPVSEAEERHRLAPALEGLVRSVDVAVSIDTTKPAIAALGLEAGVAFVNDQWGLQGDPAMAEVVASGDAGLIMMHNKIGIDTQADVIAEVRRFFDRSLSIAAKAGIADDRLVVDPGIGFGKSMEQNLQMLGKGIAALKSYGLPILVGTSRKSLFAALIGAQKVEDRLTGTIAAHLTARTYGANLFRVHDCVAHRDAFAVMEAIALGG